MTLRHALRELLSDEDGYLSTGRAISLLGAAQGSELCNVGLAVALIRPDLQGFGLAIIGIGAGFYTGGALLKFGQKGFEARIAAISPSAPDSAGDAHV